MSLSGAAARLVGRGGVRAEEPMARHTSYRIGGRAGLYVVCDSMSELISVTSILAEEEVEWTVLGKGTNVLVADSGYRGAVLVLGREFRRREFADERLEAGAGCVLAHLVREAYARGAAGLEFAVGVPGTLGGALVMNAGTREEWIGAVVESVTVFEPGAGLCRLRGDEVEWGYRRTDLQGRGVIVEAQLRLPPGDLVDVRRRMDAAFRRRARTQPRGKPSAGSVFRNPEGDSAGRLIESAGMKGRRVGGAAVSEVHANFIVNEGGATARDVLELMHLVRESVKEEHGVELTPEVRFLGSFS